MTLNWRRHGVDDNPYWIAQAARAVGGWYRIERYQVSGGGPYRFAIRYLYRTGPGAWNDPGIGKTGGTLDEAMALAQADHDRRAERKAAR